MENRRPISYSFEDIRRYKSGLMSREEMHAFEKASMEDPFLSDALEGYMASDMEAAGKHLSHINDRVTGGSSTRQGAVIATMPRRNFAAWKVAAMVVLIAGAGLITWNILHNKTTEETPIAKVEEGAVPVPHIDIDSNTFAAATPSAQTPVQEQNSTRPTTKNQAATTARQLEKPSDNTLQSGQAADPAIAAMRRDDAAETVMNDRSKKAAAPIISVNKTIQVTGISIHDHHVTDTMAVAPAGGWKSFSEKAGKQLLAAMKNGNREMSLPGEIVVEFHIGKEGVPEKARILQSTDTAFDDDAIRILKEGPRWQPRETKARVAFRY